MTSKSPVRFAEDVDEAALSFAEVKILCYRRCPFQGKDGLGYTGFKAPFAEAELFQRNHRP